MARYAILEHDHPWRHWDLFLEAGEVLRSWRLAEPPALGRVIAAEAIGDHRRLYLDYEGPVSGGRGVVVRWDAGQLRWLRDSADEVLVELSGTRLCGHARLRRTAEGWQWEFDGTIS
ncbi:MAG: hypothetical protein NZ700_05235 [Gemmataceae bacterium]|nr:hypothetical protein [Gemmataceae bacterium]MDW8263866.1 DNA polymerase ligase N-terminal domain-containing protein [Gemmataceae bacterium]